MGQKKTAAADPVLANLKKLFAGRGKSQRAQIAFSSLKLVRKRGKARLNKAQQRLNELNKPRPKQKRQQRKRQRQEWQPRVNRKQRQNSRPRQPYYY